MKMKMHIDGKENEYGTSMEGKGGAIAIALGEPEWNGMGWD